MRTYVAISAVSCSVGSIAASSLSRPLAAEGEGGAEEKTGRVKWMEKVRRCMAACVRIGFEAVDRMGTRLAGGTGYGLLWLESCGLGGWDLRVDRLVVLRWLVGEQRSLVSL